MTGDTERVTVTLPKEDVEFLDQLVRERRLRGERTARADQVRRAVREYIDRQKRKR